MKKNMKKINKEIYMKLLALKENGELTLKKIQTTFEVSIRCAEAYKMVVDNHEELIDLFSDEETREELKKLSKKTQRYSDINRIERKAWRKDARLENYFETINRELIENIDKIDFGLPIEKSLLEINSNDKMIIQLSDTHFNELVDLQENKYDFDIASARLALYAMKIKQQIKAQGITHVVFAMTGDLINSDRRLDEKMCMATNRANASMIAVSLITYFMKDILSCVNNMDVMYVSGNESRILELGFTEIVATDNYDAIIFNILKLVFKNRPEVNFLEGNPLETVVRINKKNILFVHGTQFNAGTNQNAIQKHMGVYAAKGVTIDFTIFGHIHASYISDIFARGSSLVGANHYSTYALGLYSKAAQNIHIVRENGAIDSIKFDLQDTEGVAGYPIATELIHFNALSAPKRKHDILRIINH